MSTLKTTLSTSIVLAMGLSLPFLAHAEGKAQMDESAVAIDCVLPAEVEAMTDEAKAKLTLPVCADDAAASEEKKAEEPVIVK